MTLSLVKSPATVSLVGNDIPFKINTDNRYSTAGTTALLFLTWSDYDVADEAFTLSWGNNSVTFTCKATPDNSGTQYPTHTYGDLDVWMALVAQYMRKNYLLSQDYDVYFVSPNLKLKAKTTGEDYDLTLSDVSGNVSTNGSTAGVDPVAREGYEIICRVLKYDTGNYTDWSILDELRLTPDADGNVQFKIQEYLEQLLSFDFEFPESTTTFLFKRTTHIHRFAIEYAETYGLVVYGLYDTKSTLRYAIQGGVDRNKQAEINEEDSTWWDKFLYKKDFLTNQPRELIISPTQPVKLNFIVWKSGTTSIKLKIKVVYTDSGTTTVTKTISASRYEIFECILSYTKLDLGSLSSTKTVDYYEVWIDDQDDNRISISRIFYVDFNYRENEKIFIFKNSLGSPEVIRCLGVSEAESKFDRNSYEIINQEGFTWRDFASNNFDNTEIQSFTFNTGWLNELAKNPKAYADYLRDFYLSDTIYELINNRLYPVKIISKKTVTDQSDEYLISMEFEAERAYMDKYYTRDENMHPSVGWESKFESDEFLNP